METLRLPANDDAAVEHAAQIIRAGGLVAFPTETVYGLGGNALEAAAVMKIFTAKERPTWDPLIVHLGSREMLEAVIAKPTAQFEKLLANFMPGPLTVVLPKNAVVPDMVTARRKTVAVRFPPHPVAQRLIAVSGLPLAAPSANRFQRVSPTTADHVLADLDGRIDAILDGGPCPIGVESTVLDLTGRVPLILRQGAVTPEQLRQVLGEVAISGSDGVSRPQEGRPSPGMMSRHYAPRTKLLLTDGQEDALSEKAREISKQKFGVLLPRGWKISAGAKFDWGEWRDWAELASRLYAALR